MRLRIEDRDYTPFLDADNAPRIERRLNRPSQLSLRLVAEMPDFVPPAAEGRVVLETHEGIVAFTGYTISAADAAYLGWGARGPVYRYTVKAVSDEMVLDRKLIPARAPLVARSAGAILKELVRELLPHGFDMAGVQDLAVLPSYSADSVKCWSQHAATLARLSRAAYYAHNGAIHFQAVGAHEHRLDEAAVTFSPEELATSAPPVLLNDVTILGRTEPRAYVKDYFLGDGLTLSFNLSQQPFARYNGVFVDEEYEGSALDGLRWTADCAAGVLNVNGGKLRVAGGPVRLSLREKIELGGSLALQHCDVQFTSGSAGLLGALAADGRTIAGFKAEPRGNATRISVVIDGASAGKQITTAPGCRYVLTTRLYASQVYRREQVFHSSLQVRGGASIAADAHVILEVHVLDPGSPGSPAAISTVLYEGTLRNVPDGCEYHLLDGTDLHCELAYTRLSRAVNVQVVSTIPGQAARTRLLGALSEGAECGISSAPGLYFYTPYVPVPYEAIRVSYRSCGRTAARIADPDSIAAHSRAGDDGVRAGARRVVLPAPRTAAECELAGLALLDDSTQQARTGEYRTWSDFLPGGAEDVWPGDAVRVVARGEDFRAIVREVDIELAEPSGDHSRYTIRFANDAAAPLGLELAAPHSRVLEDVTATRAGVGSTFIADVPGAEVTAITSTTITVDAGRDPPAGGGFEVRRSDSGWGTEQDRNLAGRFTARGFTVTRLSRVQTYYLRQYDSAGRYSRYSTVLHVDYPL